MNYVRNSINPNIKSVGNEGLTLDSRRFVRPYLLMRHSVGLAQWLACPPLMRQVTSSRSGWVIPNTIIKMVQQAS